MGLARPYRSLKTWENCWFSQGNLKNKLNLQFSEIKLWKYKKPKKPKLFQILGFFKKPKKPKT